MQAQIIKRAVIGLSAAALLGGTLLMPAVAAKKQSRHERNQHAYRYDRQDFHRRQGNWGFGYSNDAYARSPNWALRNANPYGNRCVIDLGYGRYEYCNW